MNLSLRIILFFLIGTWTGLSSQSYRFISFSAKDGLSNNSIHCYFQDSDGDLWIGTQDGLNRFDGKNFKTYRYHPSDTNSLSDHFVLSIQEDRNGYLWIGTSHGLNKLNRRTGKIKRYYLDPTEKSRISANYYNLIKDTLGQIYIPHGLYSHYINLKSELVPFKNASNIGKIQIIDEKNISWGIDNQNNLLEGYDHGKRFQYKLPYTSQTSYLTLDVSSGSQKTLWVSNSGPNSTIQFFNIQTRRWLKDKIILPTKINHILITKNGIGWVCTMQGVYLIENFKIKSKLESRIGVKNSIFPGSIQYAYEDNRNNIWIGSANSGMGYYNPLFSNFELISTKQENNSVTCFAEAKNENWIGTTSGLFSLDKKNNLQKSIFSGKQIVSIVCDHHSQLWVAVKNEGIYILNESAQILKSYLRADTNLSTTNILKLFCDSKGRVFVCTESGYFVFLDKDHWISRYQNYNSKIATGWYILNVFENREHELWISKHLGIDILDQNLNLKDQILSGNSTSDINRAIVTSVTQDQEGHHWIGTLRSGIYLRKEKKLTQYTVEDGLSSNLIYGLTCDRQGRIWVMTTAGMNVFVIKENRFYSLNSSDGIPSEEFLLGSIYQNKNSQIIACSSSGLLIINQDSILFQRKPVKSKIYNLSINGKSVERLRQHLIIHPGYKTISFNFSSDEILNSKNLFYQYRILGLDNTWNNIPNDNLQITYTNLPEDKLTMQVRAAYSIHELESAEISEFHFEVKPPYWKTIWFRLFVGILAVSGLIFIIQEYNRIKYRRQLQELETQKELQQERMRISRDLHDNVGAYTSALIAGISRLETNDANLDRIGELKEYASNILGYLRETIWVLNNEKLTLTAFADRFKNYATRIMRNYPDMKLTFKTNIEKEIELKPQNSLHIFRILQEALHNACKHSRASHIEISVLSAEKLKWEIADDGVGLDGEVLDENYGLRNMLGRASEIGFTLKILRLEPHGTSVILKEN